LKRFFLWLGRYLKQTDKVLLILCLLASTYGIVLIASVTGGFSSSSTIIQIVATVLGVGLFILFSSFDTDTLTDNARLLFILSVLFLLTLIPFGEGYDDTGNRAWLRFGRIGIQPAELIKVTYAITLAKVFVSAREKHGINSPLTILKTAAVFRGAVRADRGDFLRLGSALIYLFMFIVLLFAAGVSCGGLPPGPVPWSLSPRCCGTWFCARSEGPDHGPYFPSVDTSGLGILWQTNQVGRHRQRRVYRTGLFHGTMTQSGRCPSSTRLYLYGRRRGAGLYRLHRRGRDPASDHRPVRLRGHQVQLLHGLLLCFVFGAMLLSHMLINIGMCLGLTPVVGLTLPFFSYGGSSVITSYAAMGIVAGIKMRPKPESFRYSY
jgi:rod shape determining protein RodA